ncbi:MAG: NRDE family protein [Pseudomonadota bacterium]
MCLVLLSWKKHDQLPLVIAANRDEQFGRDAIPIGWWDDQPDIVGGRDLLAGGTWLAFSRHGRFGIITNFRDPVQPVASKSRGELIPLWLSGRYGAQDFQALMEENEGDYAGFNLLYGDRETLNYFSNRSTVSGPLPAGFYALSNAALDAAWPKMNSGSAFIADAVRDNDVSPNRFAQFLRNTTPAPDAALPQPFLPLELRRTLSAPFIVGDEYGTRCSTVATVSTTGAIDLHEQYYAPRGEPTAASHIQFTFSPAPTEK